MGVQICKERAHGERRSTAVPSRRIKEQMGRKEHTRSHGGETCLRRPLAWKALNHPAEVVVHVVFLNVRAPWDEHHGVHHAVGGYGAQANVLTSTLAMNHGEDVRGREWRLVHVPRRHLPKFLRRSKQGRDLLSNCTSC
jgi:hypothetical protein